MLKSLREDFFLSKEVVDLPIGKKRENTCGHLLPTSSRVGSQKTNGRQISALV